MTVIPMTSTDRAAINPYRAPQSAELGTDSSLTGVLFGDPAAPLETQVIEKGLLNRRVSLEGRYEGVIRWNASRGNEFVSLNDQVIASQFVIFSSVPRFESTVTYHGRLVSLVVEVKLLVGLMVSAFQISIDGDAIYQEGDPGKLRCDSNWRPRKPR